jgi:hypothetical protein
MMRYSKTITTLAAFAATNALAFEIDTHARITQEAFRKSVLFSSGGSNPKITSLGLMASRKSNIRLEDDGKNLLRASTEIPLGSSFYDMTTNPPFRREVNRYDYFYGLDAERKLNRWEPIAKYLGTDAPFLADWLSRGAVREDDAAGIIRALKYREQPNDAPGRINRYCNHFYDPIPTNTAALNNAGIGASFFCSVAPDDAVKWGLGTLGARGEGARIRPVPIASRSATPAKRSGVPSLCATKR